MRSKRFSLTVLVSISLILSACSLPVNTMSSTDAINTAVAATIAAQLAADDEAIAEPATRTPEPEETRTDEPTAAPADTATVVPTATAEATATLVPTNTTPPTATPIPCNAVTFIKDVTIPDGTDIVVGTGFVKTWRLKNIGSCSWNSSYDLVFIDGNAMGGPAAQPLTAGVVAPNQTVDVSVSLTAPATVGAKTGRWGIRTPEGIIFTLSTGPFWVKIDAVAAEALESTLTAILVSSESGAAKSNVTTLSYPNVGDDIADITYQGFLSFDISAIPADAVILEVKTNFKDYDTLGNPFAGLGCLRMYPQNFGALDSGDYTPGSPLGAVSRWCNTGELDVIKAQTELVAAVQERVGHTRAKFRIHFNQTATDGDNVTDMVRFGDGITLIIKYSH